jgi:hypothetical protein
LPGVKLAAKPWWQILDLQAVFNGPLPLFGAVFGLESS